MRQQEDTQESQQNQCNNDLAEKISEATDRLNKLICRGRRRGLRVKITSAPPDGDNDRSFINHVVYVDVDAGLGRRS